VALGVVCKGAAFATFTIGSILATVPFFMDFVLEIVLITRISKVGEPLTSLKDSGCFPVGSSYDSIVLLTDMAGSIKMLAGFNIAIAVVGAIGSVVQTAVGWSKPDSDTPHPESSGKSATASSKVANALTLVEIVASILELVIGLYSLIINTLPFMESLDTIEIATLMPTSKEFCYSRNPELDATDPVGFHWQTSVGVHFLWLLPATVVLLMFVTLIASLWWDMASKAKQHASPEEENSRAEQQASPPDDMTSI